MASIVGIDIGHSNLKIAALRKVGSSMVIESLQCERLGSMAARRGNEFNAQGVAAVIRRMLDTGRISPSDCVLGLHGKEVIFKFIDIPPVGEAHIRKLLEYEQAESAKAIQQETVTDYQVLDIPRDTATMLALVGTARAADLDEDANLMAAAKVPLKGIVPKSIALHKLMVDSGIAVEGQTVMLLDIGSDSTEIIISRGHGMLLARSANIGGKAFTESISKSFGVIPEVAEEIKLVEGSIIVAGKRPSRMNEFREGFDELISAEGAKFRNDPQYSQKLSRALSAAADQVRNACDAAVRFATVQTKIKGLSIDRLVLSGGASKLPGLLEYFNSTFNIECVYWDPIGAFNFSGVPVDKRDVPTEFANALALAYIAAKENPGVINLVPSAVREKLYFKRVLVFAYIGAVLMVLGMLGWWLASSSSASSAVSMQEEIAKLLNDANKNKGSLRDLEEAIALEDLRTRKVLEQSHYNLLVLKFLTALREKLPETMLLSDVSFEPVAEGRVQTADWRFVVSGFVNKDVPPQQQPVIVQSFASAINALPYVVANQAVDLGAVEKESKAKNRVNPEKGSYKFTFNFVVSENGELRYDEIRKP